MCKGVIKMKQKAPKVLLIVLVAAILGTTIITINNLSTIMMITAAKRNANAGTQVIYRQVDANGNAVNNGGSQNNNAAPVVNNNTQNNTPANNNSGNNTPANNNTQNNEPQKPADNNNTDAPASTGDVQKAVDMYVKAINNAKANAKTVTLVKDGALNYNGIFEAGAFSKFAPMLKAFFKLEDVNGASDKSELPPKGADVKLDAKNVKEASIKEEGGNYIVEITLNNSENPTLGDGGVGSVVNIITNDQITGGVESIPGIELSNIKLAYENVKITATIDKATGNLTYLIADAPSILYLDAKALMLSINNASVGIECISEFSLAY